MEGLIVFAILLGLGFFVGSRIERQHFDSLKRREEQTRDVYLSNVGGRQPIPEASDACLVVGSVVISSDYFKTFIAAWMNLFGGRIQVYETLLERGRREAILRMKEDAIAWGASRIVNIRLETAEIGTGEQGNGLVALEVIAYGTGLR